MRLLFTTFPAIGHLHALAPLALAAKRAGHEVCVATAPDLVPWSITCGLPSRPVGPLVRTLLAEVPADRPGRLLTDIWPRAVVRDLTRLVTEWRPDVVVHEEGEYAAVLVAARLGLPCVTQSWATPAASPFERAEALTRLAPLWAREGSSDETAEDQSREQARTARTTGQLYLDACPPPYQLGGLRGLDRVEAVRAVPFDGPAQQSPSWLSRLARPAVYVTLGADPAYSTIARLQLLADGVSAVAASVVLTTGPHAVAELGDLPDNVVARPYLPQSQVLPHVDAVVSQGGAGGLIGALLQALPHLVVPGRSQSQQDVASVTAGIGTGLRLREEQLDPGEVGAAVRELLSDVRFELAASKVRAQIELQPGPDQALELVTSLAG
jgi:UDP:flavonoid glycosyltransferase YjiC (YdhE family)